LILSDWATIFPGVMADMPQIADGIFRYSMNGTGIAQPCVIAKQNVKE